MCLHLIDVLKVLKLMLEVTLQVHGWLRADRTLRVHVHVHLRVMRLLYHLGLFTRHREIHFN